jgi:hypothetical protein
VSLVTSSPTVTFVAADVSPLIIPAGEQFEPAHAGCYDEIEERPACQSIRFPAGCKRRAGVWPGRTGMGEISLPTPRADFQRDGGRFSVPWVEDPIETVALVCHLTGMNILLLMVVLLLLFGGGGFYFGGPVIGGSGLGLVLLICLVVFLTGGFRSAKS